LALSASSPPALPLGRSPFLVLGWLGLRRLLLGLCLYLLPFLLVLVFPGLPFPLLAVAPGPALVVPGVPLGSLSSLDLQALGDLGVEFFSESPLDHF